MLLEFTFCIMLLLVMYLGAITLGLFLQDYNTIPKIARDGARQAALTGSEGAGVAAAKVSAWTWGLDSSKLDMDVKKSSDGSKVAVICNVKYTSTPFSRLFPTLFEGEPIIEKQMTARSIFKWWDESE